MIMALAATTVFTACGPSRGYWGVEQRYDIPGGQVYYGVGGDTGPRHDKKYYKEQRKRAKKAEKARRKAQKEREKYLRKQNKEWRKHHR